MNTPGPPDDGSVSAKVFRVWNRASAGLSQSSSDSSNDSRVGRALDATQGWLDPFFANRVGFLIVVYSFAFGYGASYVLGYPGGEVMQSIAGILIALVDLGLRLIRHRSNWLQPASGGTLFFVPVFFFGVLWAILDLIA